MVYFRSRRVVFCVSAVATPIALARILTKRKTAASNTNSQGSNANANAGAAGSCGGDLCGISAKLMLGVAAPAPSHVLRGTPSEPPSRGTTPASDSLNSTRIGEGDGEGEGQAHPNAPEGTGHDGSSRSHLGGAGSNVPQPEHSHDDWTGPISDGVCKDEPEMWTCKKEKIHGDADERQYNVYRFKAGTFKLNAQFLVPPNTYIVGNDNPNPELLDVESEAKVDASEQASEGDNVLNGPVKLPFDLDHPEKLIHPDYSKQTLFLATAGAVNDDDPYCKQDDLFHGNANQRVGLVLSSHTGVVDVSYQGIDVIRPEDNGGLCGGAAFETKGCVQNDCKGALNNGGSDGKASENVVLKNIRVNGFYYEADRKKIGKLIPGNDRLPPPVYTKPNGVRASQVAVWVPQSRDGSVSKNIFVKNMVVLSSHADGINLHAGVDGVVLENSYMQNSGDDIFAIWGATKDSKRVLMKNTVGYNPGTMKPGWYGQCVATYGMHTAYFKNHVCKSPLLTKVTRWPWDDVRQHISVSMLGMHGSFSALYKEGGRLKFKNYFFGDLANPAAKHEDHRKGPPDMSRWPISRFWWSDTDDGVRAPFYKWGSVEKWGVKVHFKENWDEAAELQFDAWMKEKMSPGWHPLEERVGAVGGYNGVDR